jgi:hypothetical protein
VANIENANHESEERRVRSGLGRSVD